MTVSDVAIHWMPLIESMEQSVGNIGKMLLMAGQSECFQKVRLEAEERKEALLRHKDDGDMRTHCPEMPLHYRTANGGPDVSDHRTAYPSMLFARAHRSRPPLPAIDRAIRTAIRDGPYSTDDRPRLATWFQAQTYRAGVKIACTARTLAILSRCIPLAYWNEGRYHILFEYSDAPCLPWHAEHPILAKVGLSEFHHRDGLDLSMSLFSIVTFIHSHRSSDAFHPRKQEYPRHLQGHCHVCSFLMPCATTSPSFTTTGTLCWCARAGGLAKSDWAVRGKVGYDPSCKQAEEEFNTHTYTELALETKFGLIVEGFGYHSFSPTRTCWTGRRSAFAFPEHRLLELPRILRSIPDEVVEMMRRRVVFMFEEFFKSLSTQVRTALLESARINLFSGDNAWQRALEPAAVTPSCTNHHCSGGMNRRALPCDDHPATLVRLRKQQHQQHTTDKQAMSNPLLIFPSLSRPPWRPSQQQQQQQPTHPPPPMQQQQRMHHHHHLQLNTFPSTRQATAAGGSWLVLLGTGGDSTSYIFGWKQQQR
ncbi:hypothetical protein PTSG_09990 [Salpingoeca rosetta]|uniref:Uncharacterized protein n=1 Tax=Salpingoeca rosetta (strain ATCC 50818 / BSB-021) TaxID=946362 RepID=F2UP66_SALR5|nr:uncharacterized protein PTSG_09990 [Salpingoeca rosetta]EGD79421.1 hypothetical protein PTSG_09990 [Salpingoeca rosetta]|eukprot:XP_004988902.1 hypothetical protein PTSG_09990 [Salpingoeca rosetta]